MWWPGSPFVLLATGFSLGFTGYFSGGKKGGRKKEKERGGIYEAPPAPGPLIYVSTKKEIAKILVFLS